MSFASYLSLQRYSHQLFAFYLSLQRYPSMPSFYQSHFERRVLQYEVCCHVMTGSKYVWMACSRCLTVRGIRNASNPVVKMSNEFFVSFGLNVLVESWHQRSRNCCPVRSFASPSKSIENFQQASVFYAAVRSQVQGNHLSNSSKSILSSGGTSHRLFCDHFFVRQSLPSVYFFISHTFVPIAK